MSLTLEKLKKYIILDGFPIDVDLKKSKGSYIYDKISGKYYLDLYAYFASLPIGHNHPKMYEPAFLDKLQYAAISNPANSDVYCEEFADFVDEFAEFCGKDFKHYFFVAGGANAVENALKTAFDWKSNLNKQKGIKIEGPLSVIYFEQGFHGRTGYSMSISSANPVHTVEFPLFNWHKITNPKLTFPLTEENINATKQKEKKAIEDIRNVLKTNKDKIASIIIEPIQGEGGDNHFSKEFLEELKQIADKNEIMLIFDEVQTGFGLTGKTWAYENFNVVPDILVFGKKAQVCGIMAGDKVDLAKNNVFNTSGRINSTWGGNLVDMIRCMQYMKIIKEENLIVNAKKVGIYLTDKLIDISEKTGNVISNIRSLGLMIAFDLPSTEIRNLIKKKLWEKDIISLTSGDAGLRLRPALNFSYNEADLFINLLLNTIEEVLKPV